MQKISSSASFADSKPHYDLLDGLRGVAALLVVWYHVFEGYAFAGGTSIETINHGYLAVDFFFILSGFVIGYAYDDRWGRTLTVKNFFKRRLVRLHPMVVLGAVLGAITFFIQGSVQWDGSHVATSLVMVALLCAMFFIPAVPGAGYEVRGNGEMFLAQKNTESEAGVYGLGIIPRKLKDGRTVYEHNGTLTGWNAQLVLEPESRSGITIVTNSDKAFYFTYDLMEAWADHTLGEPVADPLLKKLERMILYVRPDTSCRIYKTILSTRWFARFHASGYLPFSFVDFFFSRISLLKFSCPICLHFRLPPFPRLSVSRIRQSFPFWAQR